VHLEVEDNGRGLPQGFALGGSALPASGSYGLRGMQERLASLGGRMELEARPEGGTRLRVSLPFAAAESKNAG
jgi:two-component system sensor histidine kinase UhpB